MNICYPLRHRKKDPKVAQRSSGLSFPPQGHGGRGGGLPPPWFQRARPTPGSAGAGDRGPEPWGFDPHWESCGGRLLLQWVWKAEHQAEEDYSRALRSPRVCLPMFWTCLGLVTPSFFPVSSFGNGNAYSVPGPLLYSESTELA